MTRTPGRRQAFAFLVAAGVISLAAACSSSAPGTSAAAAPVGATGSAATPAADPASGTPAATPGSRTPTAPAATPPPKPAAAPGLDDPRKKEIAMELVSSAENSSLDWKAQFKYIQDINDGRGYTGGIIGFCSGTGDMLDLVKHYTALHPGNALAPFLPALTAVDGSASHAGLGTAFTNAWVTAASDPLFQQAQDDERDDAYFNPAVNQAKADGLHALGQFIYYDAMVMHGPGSEPLAFGGIRAAALRKAKPPAQGGDEKAYLNAFLDARKAAMLADPSHQQTDRVDTEQRLFLKAGNLNLNTPLHWSTYGDSYTIAS